MPKKRVPHQPPLYTKQDIAAIKALAAGNAEEGQQKHAIKLLINKICKTYDMTFIPESQRYSDFAEGSRFVGLQLVHLINKPRSTEDNNQEQP